MRDQEPRRSMPQAADPGDDRICVILNPGSGSRGDDRPDLLRDLFKKHPGRFALRPAVKGDDLPSLAAAAVRDGFGTVAAAGGDGTINAVAGALAGTGRNLGVVPMGTFNYVARSLGVPLEIDEAVEALATLPPRPLQIGEVNGRVFLNNASLGAYASILHTRESVYRRFGRSRLAAHWSVLVTLLERRSPLAASVTVDGERRRVRTPMAFVANNPFQLEQFGFDEAAERVRGGEFALFLAPDREPAHLIRFAIDLGLGLLRPGRDVELIHGRDILVETQKPRRLVARDGEKERMDGPFRFVLRRDALSVIAPAVEDGVAAA